MSDDMETLQGKLPWLPAKEAVLAQENIKKRKFPLCSRCYLCEEHAETVNHLFLHCKWTYQLWRIFSSLRKITWVKPRNIAQLLNCWINIGNTTIKEERWRIVPVYGGQCGKKGTKDVLRARRTICRILR